MINHFRLNLWPMIISHSHKFILFCNPGTGTAPLLRLLSPWQQEPIMEFGQRTAAQPFYHLMSPTEAEWAFEALDYDFHDYRRITLVRNPFTRLPALYQRVAETDAIWRIRRKTGLGQPSFGRWLQSTRTDGRGAGGRAQERWRRFGTWSLEAWTAGLVTDVLRAEALPRDLGPLFQDLGLNPGALPPVAAEPVATWPVGYDDATLALMAERYGAEIETYGYSPPRISAVA
jgi:hypothetical protein